MNRWIIGRTRSGATRAFSGGPTAWLLSAVLALTACGRSRAPWQEAAQVMVVVPHQLLDVAPGRYAAWTWWSDSTAPECSVSGHFAGQDGGRLDFEVLVMNDDQMANLRARDTADALGSGRTSAVQFQAKTLTPGRHWLVVSNAFSLVTLKRVVVDALIVRCAAPAAAEENALSSHAG